MRIKYLLQLMKPKLAFAKLKGIHPFHYRTTLIAKRLGGNFNTILDVGANVGDFYKAASYTFPRAKVEAFEPIPNLFKYGVYHKYALGDKSERKYFNYDLKNNGTSSFLKYDKVIEEKYKQKKIIKTQVRVARFDGEGIRINRPCFLKIDVEGYEKQVLKGFGERLKEVDVACIEVNFSRNFKGQSKPSEVIALMERAGFTHFLQDYIDVHNLKGGCELFFYRR